MKRLGILLLVLAASLFIVPAVSAQDPIESDRLVLGAVTSTTPQVEFTFTAGQAMSIEVEVLAIADGFVPQLVVLLDEESLGVWYAVDDPRLVSTVTLAEAGDYSLLVGNANDTVGRSVITIRGGSSQADDMSDTAGDSCTHIVQQGDHLSSIARQYEVTVDALLAANPQITNPSIIHQGNAIAIPACQEGTAQ